MKRTLTTLATSLALLALSAQVNNALDLDGLDDELILSNGSARIAGATGISLACWVFPRNTAPEFPDFDGFAGFRNDADADFYLTQISPASNVEGRFRNSAGTEFTVTLTGVPVNAWSFIALVYDGSRLRIYRNGTEGASVTANGTITNTVEPFRIGNLPYFNNDFLLNGKVDEVSLWNRGLAPNELQCLASGAALGPNGPVLYYKFDQGVAGGANQAITQATDLVAGRHATLSGFARSGTGSNFVTGAPAAVGTLETRICAGDSVAFHGVYLHTAGGHTTVVAVRDVCDSIGTILVHVEPLPNVNVTQNGGTLTAAATAGSFTWLDCNAAMAPIAGANARTFTPTASGRYAVRIEQGSCADTSTCQIVQPTAVLDPATLITAVWPVPAQERLSVSLQDGIVPRAARVVDAGGRTVAEPAVVATGTLQIPVAHLDAGLYFLQLHTTAGSTTLRILKE